MVERDTQKGIIIGHKGYAIKRVGAEARKDLEFFFGKKVYLELFVKVNKKLGDQTIKSLKDSGIIYSITYLIFF